MPDPVLLLTFAAASIALILVPGPNLVSIVTQSMPRGTRPVLPPRWAWRSGSPG